MRPIKLAWISLFPIALFAHDVSAKPSDSLSAVQGKSIILSWSDHISFANPDGRITNDDNAVNVKIYVGVKNTIFSTFDNANYRQNAKGVFRRKATQTQFDTSDSQAQNLSWRRDGGTLVAYQNFFKHGARKLIVSFSDDYSSCSLDVIIAKEQGKGVIKRAGQTVDQADIYSKSCSIQPGNIFDNP